jgi:hypothetical protein
MPPLWFLIFVCICAGFAAVKAIRGFRGEGLYVAGERVSPALVAGIFTLFLFVLGIIAAIKLGFITDYAP